MTEAAFSVISPCSSPRRCLCRRQRPVAGADQQAPAAHRETGVQGGWQRAGLGAALHLGASQVGRLPVPAVLVSGSGIVTELHPFARAALAELLIPCALQSSSADPPRLLHGPRCLGQVSWDPPSPRGEQATSLLSPRCPKDHPQSGTCPSG